MMALYGSLPAYTIVSTQLDRRRTDAR